ncbi:hypothetical protein NMY22_g14827 [Coprinellus aureogranulatus]|nr:hypothetical protein NMY22_g14827 [Coprinellus aureogranulatus]
MLDEFYIRVYDWTAILGDKPSKLGDLSTGEGLEMGNEAGGVAQWFFRGEGVVAENGGSPVRRLHITDGDDRSLQGRFDSATSFSKLQSRNAASQTATPMHAISIRLIYSLRLCHGHASDSTFPVSRFPQAIADLDPRR